MRSRVMLLALVTFLGSISSQLYAQCGVERWSVKTGTDADVSKVNLSSSTSTTISTMRSWPTPASIPSNNRISPYETTQWVLNATMTKYKLETDSDYHIVIADSSGNTMIAEIPSPNCVGAGSPFATGIQNARNEFDAKYNATTSFQTVSVPVQIKGVGMFDFLHGQTGVAPNGIEIHPVLDIVFNPSSGGGVTALSNGQTVASLSGAQGSWQYFKITVPSGQTSLAINMSGGSGDADLYVKLGSQPTSSSYDYRPYLSGNNESVSVTNPAAGDWYIGVYGYSAYSGVSLTATYSGSTGGGGGAQQLIGNPGFENGSSSPAPWTVSSGVIDNSTSEAAHSGSWKAWMCGYGSAHTDSVLQTVTIPSTATTATLSLWLHIDTAETTTTTAYDTVKIQLRNSSGTVLTTLATYSNLNAASGYTQKSFNVLSYKGQTVQVYVVGSEDSSQQTSFVLDDFALNVQ